MSPQPGTYAHHYSTGLSYQFVIWLDGVDKPFNIEDCNKVHSILGWCKPIVTFLEPDWMRPGDYLTVRECGMEWYRRMLGGAEPVGHTAYQFHSISTATEQSRHQHAEVFLSKKVRGWVGFDYHRVISHEVMHACGLNHRADGDNWLMNPGGKGYEVSDGEKRIANTALTKLVTTIPAKFHFFT
jgi:hypothetical protein